MRLIVQKKGYRLLPFLLLAVAMAVLVFIARDTQAVHNNGLLEIDGDVEFQTGTGFDPTAGGSNCPFSVAGPDSGDPDDCIATAAAFDWADNTPSGIAGEQGLCIRAGSGYIATNPTLPSVLPAGASLDDVECSPDFTQGSTEDTSYHTGSDKDYQEIWDGSTADWGCVKQSNATNKSDLLNAAFVLATSPEGGVDHQMVYFMAERDSENGDVFNGFWVLQDKVVSDCPTSTDGDFCTETSAPDASCPTDSKKSVHICGDVLILFNYTSGGRIGTIAALQWQRATNGAQLLGCNGVDDGTAGFGFPDTGDDCEKPEGPGIASHAPLCLITAIGSDCRVAGTGLSEDFCGRVNGTTTCTIAPKQNEPFPPPCSGPGSFATPWEPNDTSPTAVVDPPTFSEVGIDLTAFNLELPCVSAFLAESRSAPSTTATLKDYSLAPTGTDCASSINTEIHNVANHGDTDSDIQGSTVTVPPSVTVHDRALLHPTGPGGADNLTGSVDFELWVGVTDCGVSGGEPHTSTQNVAIPGPGIPVNTIGGVDSSNLVITNLSGAPGISYMATLNADSPYTDATSPCETLFVQVQPDIVTVADASEGHIGDTLQDTATLSNGFNPTGSITFKLFAPGVDPCDPLSTAAYTENVTVDAGNGNYSTVTGFAADQAGTWEWTAHYSGDANNLFADSPCPDTDEQVVIINPSTVLTKSAEASVVTTVTYTYTEENDGDVPLTNPAVNDVPCGAAAEIVQDGLDPFPGENTGDVNGDDELDVGEIWNFTCTQVYNGTGEFINVATGTAVDPQGFTVLFCGAGDTTIDNVAMTVCDPDETDTRTVIVSVTIS